MLCVEQIYEIDEQRKHNHELLFEVARQSLAKYYNWNRGNNASIKPSEVWPMRYDIDEPPQTTDTEPTREEKIAAIQEVADRVKKRRKKRG